MVKFYKKIVSSKGHISILAATGIEVIEDVVGRGLGLSQGQRFPIEPGSPAGNSLTYHSGVSNGTRLFRVITAERGVAEEYKDQAGSKGHHMGSRSFPVSRENIRRKGRGQAKPVRFTEVKGGILQMTSQQGVQ